MADSALIDTGAILALLDRTDVWHELCSKATREVRYPVTTSEAVLTELFHLLDSSRIETAAAWRFVRSGAISISVITGSELHHLERLMTKYKDRPMDFADATLVYLAEREELTTILTTDHSDFETYRISGKKRFRILPSTWPK
jgi:predicted nucleic acid-binding protein